jgi:hypothetical protein
MKFAARIICCFLLTSQGIIDARPALEQNPYANSSNNSLTQQSANSQSLSKPRVFFQSASYGNNQNASRNQSMEMSKDFEQDCPSAQITINQQTADYTVALNHIEVGLLVRDNQIQVADKNGDLISKTKEGGSIRGGMKKACEIILGDWARIQQGGPGGAQPQQVSAQ